MLEEQLHKTNQFLEELNQRLAALLDQAPFAAAVPQDTAPMTEPEPAIPEDEPASVSASDVTLTLDDVRAALRGYAQANGRDAAKEVLNTVAGVTKVADLQEDEYGAVIIKCGGDV